MRPRGPGTPFQLLFTDDAGLEPSLPQAFRRIYPGDWHVPTFQNRPYIYSNCAQSRDGRISFNEPGMEPAVHVTKADPHDRWLMGLLRMRADAILVGDKTVNVEADFLWTAESICPHDAEAFAAQRRAEGRAPVPLLVILSFDGNLNFDAACFGRRDTHIVLATTSQGATNVRGMIQCAATIDLYNLGEQRVDLQWLVRILYRDYGVRNLLCEGGAHVFGAMLDARLVDEEFLTLCPTFVGRSEAHFRPSYCEGVAWLPETAPYSRPISLHRAGDYLFLRTRCKYQ